VAAGDGNCAALCRKAVTVLEKVSHRAALSHNACLNHKLYHNLYHNPCLTP
jgi:hypothetical protein